MARRESFLLRTDPEVLDALRRWAADDVRCANAQLYFVLWQALRMAGRLPRRDAAGGGDVDGDGHGEDDGGQAGGTSSNRTPKNSE